MACGPCQKQRELVKATAKAATEAAASGDLRGAAKLAISAAKQSVSGAAQMAHVIPKQDVTAAMSPLPDGYRYVQTATDPVTKQPIFKIEKV